MRLPILMPDVPEQRYDCHGCTNCCRELVVHLTVADRQRIDAGKWAERLGTAPYVRLGAEWVLAHRDVGGCVFLTDAGKCAIHAESGPDAKPLACRLYPFTMINSFGIEHVGIRFDCPSVASSKGKSLGAFRQPIAQLIKQWEAEGPAQGSASADLIRGVAMTDAEHAVANRKLDDWFRSDRPPFERIRGAAVLASTLSEARLDRVRGPRFEELLTILIAHLPEQVAETPPDDPPSTRQMKLFREWVFAHLEYATFGDMRAGFWKRARARIGQLSRARAMARGVGHVPRLGQSDESPLFETVERVHPATPSEAAAIGDLWIRYLRIRISSSAAWGPGHGGHDFAMGLQTTLLALAVAGWIARWSAAWQDRTACTFEDWASAIGKVDRTATRSPVLRGASARLRIRYLAGEAGIERLLCRYLSMPDARPQ